MGRFNNSSMAFLTTQSGGVFPYDGLYHYWKLDGDLSASTGTSLYDGNGVAGYTTGLMNQCLVFDNYYIQKRWDEIYDYSCILLTDTTMTQSIWVKITNNTQQGMYYQPISGMGLYIDYEGKVRFISFNSGIEIQTTFNIPNNTWVHYVYQMTPTNVKLYINNVNYLDESGDWSVDWGININNGVTLSAPTQQIFYDECGVWGRILSTDEITSLYNKGAGLQPV